MRKLFKNVMALSLAATMVVGTAGLATASVATGTDVSNGKNWTSYSVHGNNAEDKGEWEKKLNKVGQKYNNTADAYKSYGENAKITTQTSSSFNMNVVSTGWSATWHPYTGKIISSNPWGVTATKVVNVERGRYYTIAFKIKSTLFNEITKTVERKDGTAYNVGTGKYNYLKHIHVKAYDNTDPDGKALTLTGMSAKQGTANVLITSNKNFKPFITLNSKNTVDDGWVTFTATVKVPCLKSEYQKKAKNPTMGIKFAFGAFLKEYINENDMKGTIQVKDFTVKAGIQSPGQPTKVKAKAGKKKVTVSFKKAAKAKKYEVKVSLKKNMKKAKTVTTSKKKVTVKKLKSKKTYYVTVRAYYMNGKTKVYGGTSSKVKVKVK